MPPFHALSRALTRRALSTSAAYHSPNAFRSAPAPPRLPRTEQELFEKLQKQSTGAFSQPRSDADLPSTTQAQPQPHTQHPAPARATGTMHVNQSPDSAPASASSTLTDTATGTQQSGAGFQHPNMRRGAPPEFEGEVNPKTGEVGGPKNDPLRWGAQADWSFNGRVTDF